MLSRSKPRASNPSRRTFLQALSAGLLPPALLAKKKKGGYRAPIAFSTLGCPEWDWETILSAAKRHGYAAIELRGLQGEMDLTQHPQFQGAALVSVVKNLESLALPICSVGSSVSFHHADAAEHAKAVEEAKRWVDLAFRLRSPFVRVFGDKLVEGEAREKTISRIVAGLQEAAEHARGSRVALLLESHGDFTDSATLAQILEGVNSPAVGLLWDTHHTFVSGKEKPEETFQRLGKWVAHTHVKDSVPSGEGRRYVLTGGGEVPVAQIVKTLASGGYRGYYCFEWEKVWHPEIEDPDWAFPHYASVMREYLREAGVPEVY